LFKKFDSKHVIELFSQFDLLVL